MRLYNRIIRPFLFRTEAEWMHDRVIRSAEKASASSAICRAVSALTAVETPGLATEVAGLHFRHPVGLAAGFDKSGRAIPFWEALGFSHVEIGSVSAEFSAGNPKPRLFRIPADRGIVVNYGLPNDGADRIAARVSRLRLGVPLGINLVNTNRGPAAPPESDDAVIDDYLESLRRLRDCGDYFVLNLSCPNTQDGRAFVSDSCRSTRLLHEVDALQPAKPVFLKVAPFSGERELDAFLEAVSQVQFVSGFAVNLPPGKPPGLTTPAELLKGMPGAVSGKPAEAAVNRTIEQMYRRMDRTRYSIIAAGGVFCAEDAYQKIRLGASLVQLLTALVYEGPFVVRRIAAGLARLLERDGFRRPQDAVGCAHARL